MTAKLISQLVDIAISLAQTGMHGGNTAGILLEIARSAAAAYQKETGEPLDPRLLNPETPL
jgi:hypothetical protein